jgi:hypothetical protein
LAQRRRRGRPCRPSPIPAPANWLRFASSPFVPQMPQGCPSLALFRTIAPGPARHLASFGVPVAALPWYGHPAHGSLAEPAPSATRGCRCHQARRAKLGSFCAVGPRRPEAAGLSQSAIRSPRSRHRLGAPLRAIGFVLYHWSLPGASPRCPILPISLPSVFKSPITHDKSSIAGSASDPRVPPLIPAVLQESVQKNGFRRPGSEMGVLG